MKKILLALLLLCNSSVYAQENKEDYVMFYLQQDGTFLNENGEKYTVLNYDGKTASELYDMVKNNVMAAYNDPKSVMSENEGQVISVNGYTENLWRNGIDYGGDYKLTFRFKDNKIRVDAPSISSKLYRTTKIDWMNKSYPNSVYFYDCARKCCNSNSEKNKKRKMLIENNVNVPINYLLGKIKTENNSSAESNDDDW